MISRTLGCALLLVCSLVSSEPAAGQNHRRDPLTDAEIDKLRDTAQVPEERLKLYIGFARARLERAQQIHADAKAADREAQTREAFQEFLDVYDELNTNVDTYADRGEDLRKALKPVIEADTEFGGKIRAFKSSLGKSDEAHEDEFLVGSALEAVDSAAKDHRDLLAQQEEVFKHKKKQNRKEDSARNE
ncbi:MAG: hypothetical protein J2P13_02620 [Acidobacteria bacterium]|nr:hypothetical protein [Acidobacteriota bacterium]